jgi:hypothetical protein
MLGLFAKFLALIAALPLSLPAGWCCFLGKQAQVPNAEQPAARCCCCGGHSSPGQGHRVPVVPERCPCADRQAPALDHFKSKVLDSPLLTSLAPASQITASAAGKVADFSLVEFAAALHLLHCVWLC